METNSTLTPPRHDWHGAKWLALLILFAVLGVLFPRLSARVAPPPPPEEPTVTAIKAQRQATEPWAELDNAVTAFVGSLPRLRQDIQRQRLAAFNKGEAAQRQIQEWITRRKPLSVEDILKSSEAQATWIQFRNAETETQLSILHLSVIDRVEGEIKPLRRHIRRALVELPTNGSTIDAIKATFDRLKAEVLNEDARQRQAAEEQADQLCRERVRAFLKTASPK